MTITNSSPTETGTPDAFAARDLAFQRYRVMHPYTSFAEYRTRAIAQGLASGKAHFSLGENLEKAGERQSFWTAGEAKAQQYFALMGLKPNHRVVDYGCGSLRVGAHFIRYLDPGCYLGLDVIGDFFEIGKRLAGSDLIDEKRPQFAVIDENAIASAVEFGADFVFSSAVCIHVHPNELPAYFGNLARITAKPGARLCFNVAVSPRPLRLRFDSWAWPLGFYRQSLRDLRFVRRSPASAIKSALRSLAARMPMPGVRRTWSADLVFKRG